MRAFRDIAIKRKLTLVIMLTSSIALLLATVAFVVYDRISLRQRMVQDLATQAEILGANSIVALSFKGTNEAVEILNTLRTKPHVTAACIYDRGGQVFARYLRSEAASLEAATPLPATPGHRFTGDALALFRPIVFEGKTAGSIYLESDTRELGDRLTQYLGIVSGVLAASMIVALLLSALLQRLISNPILNLAETAKVIAERKDYSVRAPHLGRDELGFFTETFNQMLTQIQAQDAALQKAQETLQNQVLELQHEISERKRAEQKLEQLHKQLIEASHQAGMAEVATGVLHNVGNVLNSLNVSATLLGEQVANSKVGGVGKIAALFSQHAQDLGQFLTSDPKGKQVPPYLATLADHLAQERTALAEELDSIHKNLEHVKDIVAMQQSYAQMSGLIESLQVAPLVEDALRMNEAALARHDVRVVRHFEEVPNVDADRHKVLQILVNLIRNAKYAMDEKGAAEKILEVGIGRSGSDSVSITVKDNGCGIPPENVTRIFSHGFTTKKDGHGFGLHSAALAAREMGGSLRACSDGPGRGATFILEIPMEKLEAKAA